ncbi:glycosyltransferase family 87 protein [Zavarzinella formosa]|uniref:glycosyltransferase family 87 protein n=1 Tax=Zavarzinella formosa TaxID=360055 RepID=UPI00031D0DE9|nr:glycosyltransferase family 87 protein [Zavarzinella formosa]
MADPATPPENTKAQRWFFIALMLLFVAVSIQYSMKVLTPKQDGYTRGAINRWGKQLQDMEEGANIHAKYNYPNPPVMAQMLWPISELATVNPLAGALAWFYLKVGMALFCFTWAFRLVETPTFRIPVWGKILGVALAIRPILGDLAHGNINIFILFLVMGCLYSFSRGKDLLAGLLLALAIACKVTPALFVVYFLWKRSFRVLIGTGIGLVLFFFVVPSIFYGLQEGSLVKGWDRNWEALSAWFNGMIVPYLVHGIVTPERENQSLPGVLTRLLSHSPSFSAWIDNIYVPLSFHNIADLDAGIIKKVVQGCQLLFMIAIVWLCRVPLRPTTENPAPERRGPALAAEFSFIMIGMLMFSERTWKHHCVTLLLPFVVLAAVVMTPTVSRRLRIWLAVVLAAATILIYSTSSGLIADDTPKVAERYSGLSLAVGPLAVVGAGESDMTAQLGLVPDSPGKIAQVYGVYVWAFLALLLGLGLLMRHSRWFPPAQPLQSGEPDRG